MSSVKLSFVVPAYNCDETITETLDSIQASAKEIDDPIAVYVSDNSSTDETPNRIRSFLDSHHTDSLIFNVERQSSNLGCYGNMRFLQQHCTSEWAYILCADDTLHLHSIKLIMQQIAEKEDVIDLIFFRDTSNHKIRDIVERANGSKLLSGKRGLTLFYLYGCFVGSMSNTCFRLRNKSGFSAAFNTSFKTSGDFNFYVDQLLAGSVIYLSDIETTYFRPGSPLSAEVYRDCKPFPEEKQIYDKCIRGMTQKHHERLLLKFYVHAVRYYIFYSHAVKRLSQGSKTAFLVLSQNNTGGIYATAFWCLLSLLMIPQPVRHALRFCYKAWLL